MLPSTPSTPISDTHYNFLLDLLIEERQARKTLETYVTRDFTKLQEDVAKLKQCGCLNSVVPNSISSGIDNRTEALENELRDVKDELVYLKSKYTNLVSVYASTISKTSELEQELNVLKGLKIFADLSAVANIQNQTNNITLELKATKDKQLDLISEANARKQDFIALYHKVQETDGTIHKTNENLGNVSETFKSIVSSVNSTILNRMKINIASLEQKLGNRISLINTTISIGKYKNSKEEKYRGLFFIKCYIFDSLKTKVVENVACVELTSISMFKESVNDVVRWYLFSLVCFCLDW